MIALYAIYHVIPMGYRWCWHCMRMTHIFFFINLIDSLQSTLFYFVHSDFMECIIYQIDERPKKKNYKKLQESKCYWNTASFKLEQIVMSATDIHSNGTIVNWINSFKWIDRQLNQFIRNFICRSGIEYNSPFDFKYI